VPDELISTHKTLSARWVDINS